MVLLRYRIGYGTGNGTETGTAINHYDSTTLGGNLCTVPYEAGVTAGSRR
jgi:hypothetical protein